MAARNGPHPDKPCSGGCGAMLKYDYRRKGTKCRACCQRDRRLPDRFCDVCGVKIGNRRDSATSMCMIHAQAWDERRARLRVAALALRRDPEQERRRGRAISNALLRHIPLEYRDEYRRLTKSAGLTRDEATSAIEQQIKRDTARYFETGKLQQTTRS